MSAVDREMAEIVTASRSVLDQGVAGIRSELAKGTDELAIIADFIRALAKNPSVAIGIAAIAAVELAKVPLPEVTP